MPPFITPNMLTAIGLLGSVVVSASFVLAKENRYYFLLAIAGFAVQWFGDSLDGRIAYYRSTPRKWFGLSLDLFMDWITTFLIAGGFYFYLSDAWKFLSFLYLWGYGSIMILTMLKFKLTNQYQVDSGLLGPTELRLAICMVMFGEVIFPGTLLVFAGVVNVVVLIVTFVEFRTVLKAGNELDKQTPKK